MKKRKQMPEPVQVMHLVSNELPGIWNSIKDCIGGDRYVSYQEMMRIWDQVVTDTTWVPYQIFTLFNWKRYKQIYEFDPNLSMVLSKVDSSTSKIPTEILNMLPYDSFFVNTNSIIDITISNRDDRRITTNGFFVTRNTDGPDLVFTIMGMDGQSVVHFVPLQKNDATLEESVFAGITKYTNIVSEKDDAKPRPNMTMVNFCLQYVLYLCAANADIVEPKSVKKGDAITKEHNAVARASSGSLHSTVEQWKVGSRIGKKIVAAMKAHPKEDEETESVRDERTINVGGKGTKKSPHARRGHYHHYWTGPMDGERKLVLKWTAPTYINLSDDMPAIIHPVKNK